MNTFPKERGNGEIRAADHPTWKERIAKLESYKETIANLAGEFNWGDYLLKTYNFEKAAQCFKDLTKVFPNSFEAWNNLGIAYHWEYLQTAGKSEKFQPGLVDYFVQMRERLRGESPLNQGDSGVPGGAENQSERRGHPIKPCRRFDRDSRG